jgi:hypothetical protein
MKRIRFNIGNLLVIVLVLGVGFAALRESIDHWESGSFTLTIGLLLISIILAIHRTEKRRAFWIGFALFGSAYWGLSLVPLIESRLITTQALAYLDSKVPRPPTVLYTTTNGSGTGRNQVTNITYTLDGLQVEATGDVVMAVRDAATGNLIDVTGKLGGGWGGTSKNFVRIGHTLFALLVAWLGAQLSRRLYRSSSSQEPTEPVAVE